MQAKDWLAIPIITSPPSSGSGVKDDTLQASTTNFLYQCYKVIIMVATRMMMMMMMMLMMVCAGSGHSGVEPLQPSEQRPPPQQQRHPLRLPGPEARGLPANLTVKRSCILLLRLHVYDTYFLCVTLLWWIINNKLYDSKLKILQRKAE